MYSGYAGKIGFVDLSTKEIKVEALDIDLARDFIGGYGLGVRIIFEHQKAGIDPLGPENILGFTTGPMTGTPVPTGGRYMSVCKSPLTGGWGDANSGGYFGTELKSAGWDAIFVSGVADPPQYLFVTNDSLELKDASHIWGRDVVDTEETLRNELGTPRVRVACIGPASEKLCLISGIVNDKGRLAARSGVGAVMGSKHLKAVAVYGKGKIPIADKERLSQLRRRYIKEIHKSSKFLEVLMNHGTCGITSPLVVAGSTPIKNWLLAGEQAFPTVHQIADAERVNQYQVKRYGCANCPIACGGIVSVDTGHYPVKEVHKPEYETVAAFGTMCKNDNLLSIIKMTDMCNRNGLDTISAGNVIAFAMECFEHGILTTTDTDGIDLNWGNSEAMIALLERIINREGFGDVLADGVQSAAQKIGMGSEEYAMHVGGQEPGYHSALFMPSRGTGFVCDPTPGRHTTGSLMSRIDEGSAVIAPYPELQFHDFERYDYKNKGAVSATASCYWQICTCSGICLFPVFAGNYPLLEFFNAVTGWDIDLAEVLKTGARIQTLRQAFNLREGIKSSDTKLPPRMVGIPPKSEGPLAGITIDIDTLTSEYRKAMGWDPLTGSPGEATLKELGLNELIEMYGKTSDTV
jgi:aldehyde:ferredoxin oxidoreductase